MRERDKAQSITLQQTGTAALIALGVVVYNSVEKDQELSFSG